MSPRQKKNCSLSEALGQFLNTPQARHELAIARLWQHWEEIFGPELAAMIRPLGHRKETLLLGATNSMVVQEFSYFSATILEKANTFLGTTFFQKVQIELMAGRPALDQPLLPPPPPRKKPPRPEPLGQLLSSLDPASPVTKCYRAYVAAFQTMENETKK